MHVCVLHFIASASSPLYLTLVTTIMRVGAVWDYFLADELARACLWQKTAYFLGLARSRAESVAETLFALRYLTSPSFPFYHQRFLIHLIQYHNIIHPRFWCLRLFRRTKRWPLENVDPWKVDSLQCLQVLRDRTNWGRVRSILIQSLK